MRLPGSGAMSLPDLHGRQDTPVSAVTSSSAAILSASSLDALSASILPITTTSSASAPAVPSSSSTISLSTTTSAVSSSTTTSSATTGASTSTAATPASSVPSGTSSLPSSDGTSLTSTLISTVTASASSTLHANATSLAEKLENPVPTPRYAPGGMAFILPAFAIIGLIFIIWLVHKTREYIWKLREAEDAADRQSPNPGLSSARRGDAAGMTKRGWRKKGWRELESGSEVDEKYRYDEDRRWAERDEKRGSAIPTGGEGEGGVGWRRQSDKYSKPGEWQGSRKYKSRERKSSRRDQEVERERDGTDGDHHGHRPRSRLSYKDHRDVERYRDRQDWYGYDRDEPPNRDRGHTRSDDRERADAGRRRPPSGESGSVNRRSSRPSGFDGKPRPHAPPAPAPAVEPSEPRANIHVPAWHAVKPGRGLSRKERNDRASDWVLSGSGTGSGQRGNKDRDAVTDGGRKQVDDRDREEQAGRGKERGGRGGDDRGSHRYERERADQPDRVARDGTRDERRDGGQQNEAGRPQRSVESRSDDDTNEKAGRESTGRHRMQGKADEREREPEQSDEDENESVPDAYEDEFEDRYQNQQLVEVTPAEVDGVAPSVKAAAGLKVGQPHEILVSEAAALSAGPDALQTYHDAPAYMRARATSPPPILSPPMNPTLFFHTGPATATQLVPFTTYDTATDLDSIAPTVIVRETSASVAEHARMPSIPSTAEKLALGGPAGSNESPRRARSAKRADRGQAVERTPTRSKTFDTPNTPTGTVRGGGAGASGRTERLRTPVRRGTTTTTDIDSGRATPTIRLIDSRGGSGSRRNQATLSKRPGPNPDPRPDQAKKKSNIESVAPKRDQSTRQATVLTPSAATPLCTPDASGAGGGGRRERAERKEQKVRGKVDEILRESWSERAVVSPVNTPADYDSDDEEGGQGTRMQGPPKGAVPKDEVELAHSHAHAKHQNRHSHRERDQPDDARSGPASPSPTRTPISPRPVTSPTPKRPGADDSGSPHPQRPLSPRKAVPKSGMSPSLQEAAALQGIEQRLAMLRKMED